MGPYRSLFVLNDSNGTLLILQIKSNLSLYSLDYAEACNELAGPISASLRPGNTVPFEEMSQRSRAVGNTVSNLTCLRFESQTSRSRDERVTARPTGRLVDIGSYRSLFNLIDSNGSYQVLIGPYASLCVIMGPYRSLCVHMSLCGSV